MEPNINVELQRLRRLAETPSPAQDRLGSEPPAVSHPAVEAGAGEGSGHELGRMADMSALTAAYAEVLCVRLGHNPPPAMPEQPDPRRRPAACYACQDHAAALVASPAFKAHEAAVLMPFAVWLFDRLGVTDIPERMVAGYIEDTSPAVRAAATEPDVLIVDSETGEHVEAPAEYVRAVGTEGQP